MLAPVTHILPLTTIERERIMPISGDVHVKLNQTVGATDVIASAARSNEHVLIDVSRQLGISPNAADRLIIVKVGDKVSGGMEITVGKGLIRKTLRAPGDGRVVAAGAGQVLLETGRTDLRLRAGFPGTVVQVIPGRGAVIRATGVLIQGIWGNGRVAAGVLHNLSETPLDVLTESRLDVSMRGSIILSGLVREAGTLHFAADLPVRGLILSSISPALLPVAKGMPYPIIAVEGYGKIPMNPTAYELLTTNAKREVALNAEVFDRFTGKRPEVVIPLPVSQDPPDPEDLIRLEPGQTVRIRRSPYFGAVGTIQGLLPGLTTLPSGLRAPAADVRLENGDQIVVPLVNLEVVG